MSEAKQRPVAATRKPPAAEPESALPWKPMDDGARDGRPVWLKGEKGEVAECYWRTTRQFRKSSWQRTGFFTRIEGNPIPIGFTPVAYARQPHA